MGWKDLRVLREKDVLRICINTGREIVQGTLYVRIRDGVYCID